MHCSSTVGIDRFCTKDHVPKKMLCKESQAAVALVVRQQRISLRKNSSSSDLTITQNTKHDEKLLRSLL